MIRFMLLAILCCSSFLFGCSEKPWAEMTYKEKATALLKKTPEEQKEIICGMPLSELAQIVHIDMMSHDDAQKIAAIRVYCP